MQLVLSKNLCVVFWDTIVMMESMLRGAQATQWSVWLAVADSAEWMQYSPIWNTLVWPELA